MFNVIVYVEDIDKRFNRNNDLITSDFHSDIDDDYLVNNYLEKSIGTIFI